MNSYPLNRSPYQLPDIASFGLGGIALSDARKAARMMLGIGFVLVIYGVINALAAILLPEDQLMKQVSNSGARVAMTPQAFRESAVAVAILTCAIGAVLVVLSGPVRRGNRGAITAAIVIACVIGAIAGLLVVTSLVVAAQVLLALVFAAVLAACVMLLSWLIRARSGLR